MGVASHPIQPPLGSAPALGGFPYSVQHMAGRGHIRVNRLKLRADALIQGDSILLLLDLHGHVCLEGCSLKES